MKIFKFNVILFSLVMISGCNSKPDFFIPQHDIMPDLATPVKLNYDTTSVYLSDYVTDTNAIESVLLHPSLSHDFSTGKGKIRIVAGNPDALPLLSEMVIKTKQTTYSLLVMKSARRKVTFSYHTAGKQPVSVQIAGDINGWNPQATSLTFDGSAWQTDLMLNPGRYAYQLVVDGKWMLDPANPDSLSNNIGGFNSIIQVGENSKKPMLQTLSSNNEYVNLHCNFQPVDLLVFWQNFRIDNSMLKITHNQVQIPVPEAAARMHRSYIRVFASDGKTLSNDVLIPLSDGQVILHPDSLRRLDKQAMTMYFLMIDRFVNGDKTNDRKTPDPAILSKANYFGGDLEGIIQTIRQGYFTNLGVNTIWISPVTQNPLGAWGQFKNPDTKFSGYHGYWPVTLTTVDFRFGNEKTMQNLVETCHHHGFNLLLDYVAHHIHQEHPLAKQHPDWQTSLYLPDGTLNTEQWDKHRLTTWFDVFLPTLDLSKPEVYNPMSDSALFWLTHYHIDGFRHDATKHIPEPFWRTLTAKIKNQFGNLDAVYQVGETYGNRELIGSYVSTGMMDAQFDFNVYDAAVTVFGKKNQPVSILQQSLQESLNAFGYHNLMGYISGNQDRPRFISLAGGSLRFDEDHKRAGWKRDIGVGDTLAYRRLALLHAFNFSIPGVPTIYYGDEFGMPGANDPDNRRMMYFDHPLKQESELLLKVRKLASLRRNNLAAIYGTSYIEALNDQILVIQRIYFGQAFTLVVNTGENLADIQFAVPADKITELASGFGHAAAADGHLIHLSLEGVSFEILTYKINQ